MLYYVMIRAETSAGVGRPSSIVTMSIPAVRPAQNMTSVVTEIPTDACKFLHFGLGEKEL